MNQQKDPLMAIDTLQPLEPMPIEVYSIESSSDTVEAIASLESVYDTLYQMHDKQQVPTDLTLAMMSHIVSDCQPHVVKEVQYSFESDNYFERNDVVASMEGIGRVILNTIKEIIRRIILMIKNVGAWFRNTFNRVRQMREMSVELVKRIRSSKLQALSHPYANIQVSNLLTDGTTVSGTVSVIGCRNRLQSFSNAIRIIGTNRGYELAVNAASDIKYSRDMSSSMSNYKEHMEDFISSAVSNFTENLVDIRYVDGRPTLKLQDSSHYVLGSQMQTHQAILPMAEACVNIFDQVLKYNNDWNKRDRLTTELTRMIEVGYKAQRPAQVVEQGNFTDGIATAQEMRTSFLLMWESYLACELVLIETATEAAREATILAKQLLALHKANI